MTDKIEVKFVGGHVKLARVEERNGVKIGIIEGYIATWDLDRGGCIWGVQDQFVKGAFLDSIAEHKAKNRQIRFKDHHGRTVGGFPIDQVREDDIGLFGVGEINLEVQQGREAHSLAKQGVLTDFSIGFTSLEDVIVDDVRTIAKANIWEGSIIDEPMNEKANVTAVKKNQDGKIKKITVEELKSMTPRQTEDAMGDPLVSFSKKAREYVVAALKSANQGEPDGNDEEIKTALTGMALKIDDAQAAKDNSQLQSMLTKVDNHARNRSETT